MGERQATERADGEGLLTVAEVMARLRLGRTQVYEFIRSGELESVKLGGARRVAPAAVRDFIERNTRRGIR